MRLTTLTFSAAALAATWTTSTPARADGPPGDLPRWCTGIDGRTETSAGSIEDEAKNTGYGTDRVARSIARGACGWRSSAEGTKKIRDQVAAGRAKFLAETGLTDAEADELFAIEVDQKRAEADNAAFCKAVKVDPDDVTRRELSMAKALRYLVCDRGYGGGEYDWPDVSQLEKVAQVHNCLTRVAGNFNSDTDKFAQQPWPMLEFATCNALAARIDAKKFAAEIAADKRFNRYAALWAKATLGDTLQRVAVARTRYKKIGAKKPVFEELLFTAPEQGFSAFMTLYESNKETIDKATTLAAGAAKPKQLAKTFAGCASTFEPLLVKAIADKHPTDVAGLQAAFRDTFIHFTGVAFAICEAIDGHDLVANAYATRMAGAPGATGPMNAARAAVLEVMFANGDDIPGVRDMTAPRTEAIARLDVAAPRSKETQAVIASVAPAPGDLIKVTFKKETWIEDLFDCKETNRIDRIGDDGKIIYRETCKPAGTKKHELKEEPVLVEKRFAGALKAGRFLEMRVTEGKERLAMPLAVYATKDKKQLTGYLGFVL